MQINWTVVTYIVIALFALSGFFRGWWKEGLTTFLLIILLFLLQFPGVAQGFIDILNSVLAAIWQLAPDFLTSFFADVFGISSTEAGIQADASDPNTWLLILLVFVVAAILISRILVPGSREVTPLGGVLGGLVGAFNGFIIINLVREYLDGRGLPGGTAPATEITMAGSSTVGMASPGLSIQAVDLPRFTILDSLIPWIVIIIGLFIFLTFLRTGFGVQGAKINPRVPPGYR